MRQGPQYSQRIERNDQGQLQISVPFELHDQIKDKDLAIWEDNGDGSYIITCLNIS